MTKSHESVQRTSVNNDQSVKHTSAIKDQHETAIVMTKLNTNWGSDKTEKQAVDSNGKSLDNGHTEEIAPCDLFVSMTTYVTKHESLCLIGGLLLGQHRTRWTNMNPTVV